MHLDTIGVLIDILDEEYQNQLFLGAAAAARRHRARVIGFVGGALDGPELLRFGMHRNFIYDLATPVCVHALLVYLCTYAVNCVHIWHSFGTGDTHAERQDGLGRACQGLACVSESIQVRRRHHRGACVLASSFK